jgi:tetratricopeptide (TPR) repeat protein
MHDEFGNAISTHSPTAAAAYMRAVDCQLHAWPGLAEALAQALAEAPDFALAHALAALVHGAWSRPAAAREAAALARQHAGGATPRERAHVELVSCIVEGRGADALALVLAHAATFPTDVLAASTAMGAYGLLAFSGRADHDQARFDLLEQLAQHLPAELPWLLCNRGWARIELGRVDEGLSMAQRALALRPQNGHNAHIVMHGLHESANHSGVLDFAAAWLPGYDDGAMLWGHLQWHAALAELALDRDDAALSRLLGPMLAYLPRGAPFMGLPDIASLLWRLGMRGAKPLPWAAASAHVSQHFPNGSNVFGEVHLAMLAAAARDRQALAAAQQRLDRHAQRGHAGAPVALHWLAALRALVDGDAAAAQQALTACRRELARLGGSRAQRSVIEQTLSSPHLPAS